MTGRLLSYLRANALALVALVLALGMGTAWASGLAPNSVLSRHIRDGQVRTPDLANGGVTARKLAPGVLAHLDADTLDGLHAAAFLPARATAADAARLGGVGATGYVLGSARVTSWMTFAPSYRTDDVAVDGRGAAFGRIRARCTADGVAYEYWNLSGGKQTVYVTSTTSSAYDGWASHPRLGYAALQPGGHAFLPTYEDRIDARWIVAQEDDGRVATIDVAGHMAGASCFHVLSALVQG